MRVTGRVAYRGRQFGRVAAWSQTPRDDGEVCLPPPGGMPGIGGWLTARGVRLMSRRKPRCRRNSRLKFQTPTLEGRVIPLLASNQV